jgi:hypothetical protein
MSAPKSKQKSEHPASFGKAGRATCFRRRLPDGPQLAAPARSSLRPLVNARQLAAPGRLVIRWQPRRKVGELVPGRGNSNGRLADY